MDRTLSRLTFGAGNDVRPIWRPDGRRLVFASTRDGVLNLYGQSSDGTGNAGRLTTAANPQTPLDVSPDGTQHEIQIGSGYVGQFPQEHRSAKSDDEHRSVSRELLLRI